MPEKSRGVEFHHAPYGHHEFEYEPTGGLADIFKNADYVKPDTIKNYVRQIVEQVKQSPDAESQKVCIMDLLRENNIKELLEKKNIDTDDAAEVERMTDYWIKKIKTDIIEELKKYLPDDILFFVKEKQKERVTHFNKKTIIVDAKTGQEFFLKESKISAERLREQRENCFKKLKTALADLKDPETEMPFIISPQIIGHSAESGRPDRSSLGYTSGKKDIMVIEDLLVEDIDQDTYDYKEIDEINAKKALNGILDCLRGAKFLAKNNLTTTDLNTEPIGKNFGINKKNQRGILFDLDGIMEANSQMENLVCPKNENSGVEQELIAPEYRAFGTGEEVTTNVQSMIWEIGDSIYRLAEIQEKELYKSTNFFSNQNLIAMWEKLRTFSKKMKAEKPEDRPHFDICIAKLEEIINKYLPENN